MGGVFGDWGEGMLGVSVPVWVGGGVDGRGVVSVGVRVCEPECAFVWVRAHLCLVCVFLFSLVVWARGCACLRLWDCQVAMFFVAVVVVVGSGESPR